ncbi:MAG: GTP-binding protein [Candidatus Lokiarchaeota archaeon]|nr:GTP-binding protein [Candidatus Lokiarchaeota archaeon]
MTNSQEFSFKISIIGDGGVGKTSLIKKFTKGTFERDYIQTIGAQFSRYDLEIDGDVVNLIFWDIAGQDDFQFLHPLFYRESKGCIIVFSLEENDLGEESFNHIENWHNELKKYCGDIPVVLFANKVDLIEEVNLVKKNVQDVISERKLHGYFLTSAKSGQGVHEAFKAIIEKLYNKNKAPI